jgi:bifunctional enzyme CysN/CysC
MVCAASTADAAIVLVDARKGITTQTRRHAYLLTRLGVSSMLIAVNKLDQIGYARDAFDRVAGELRRFVNEIDGGAVIAMPVSALNGDNLTRRSANTPWYDGPTLLEALEGVAVDTTSEARPVRAFVRGAVRPNPEFRGYAVSLVAGRIHAGERLVVMPGGQEASVARIVTFDGDLPSARAGQSVTLTLSSDIHVERGDVLASVSAPPRVADQCEATLIWLAESPMLPGRSYLIKCGAATAGATFGIPKHRIDVDTLKPLAARTLCANDIGVCTLHVDRSIAFDPYRENRDTGAFIVIDRLDNQTVGAGLLHFDLRRASNIQWQTTLVDRTARAWLKGQRSAVVWFTGLSGAGKSTIANLVEQKLHALGKHTYLLDGDNVRHGLSKDLGFAPADRVENVRRIAEVARLFADAGLVVLVALISPFRAERRMARERIPAGEFCEVFVDTPLAEAQKRDTKGLYRKAREGVLVNLTGVDSPYEAPEA